eukprot:gnl/TRDRNA2_/TRDRNA2_181947_c0_seq1.p1 gnl/TRDRNA2_/TRDRNA2_181947_c0~~gnl/TRDRNA2_/TRDRNA2_181947_c0_seq1.p1  ORF type:complete len:284 (+),score=50.00 gnl/TRDRNA2_/TRDRNA2_181947_c0_seq1:22-852(+)
MLPLPSPRLQDVLAELHASVTLLAERQSAPPREWTKEEGIRAASVSPARCSESGTDVISAMSRPSDVSGSPQPDPEWPMDIAFRGSKLQQTISAQLEALQDLTNVASQQDESIDKQVCGMDAFSNVQFVPHARAVPCPHCARLFFPKSMRFHEERCLRRRTAANAERSRCRSRVHKLQDGGRLASACTAVAMVVPKVCEPGLEGENRDPAGNIGIGSEEVAAAAADTRDPIVQLAVLCREARVLREEFQAALAPVADSGGTVADAFRLRKRRVVVD